MKLFCISGGSFGHLFHRHLDPLTAQGRSSHVRQCSLLGTHVHARPFCNRRGDVRTPSTSQNKCVQKGDWLQAHGTLAWLYTAVRSYAIWQDGDVIWDSRTTLVYPVICSVAGVFAGLFGIGGGIVKGPLMLEMNVHPAVSCMTSF